ncbi:MAG: KH domain-containing protein [Chloroflexota bacterium]|nr:MAG: KH domain-containing protein [Chloroflexota bacterium]
MKDLIEFIARSLVENPDEASVTEVERETGIVFQLHVAPEDMGRVIGKQGRIAHAMRTLLKAASVRSGKRAVLEIV